MAVSWLMMRVALALLALACLIQAQDTSSATTATTSAATQTISVSSVPTTLTLPPLNASAPAYSIAVPAALSLYLTLNLCSSGSDASFQPTVLFSEDAADPPSFAIGTRTSSAAGTGGVGTANKKSRSDAIWSLTWYQGFANWTATDGTVDVTHVLVGLNVGTDGQVNTTGIPSDNGNIVVQVGISDSSALQSVSPEEILLGDTTASSVLLLSPLIQSAEQLQPQYPNYTLPAPQLVFSGYDSSDGTNLSSLSTEMSIIVVPTTSSPTNDGLDSSLCAVQNANTSTDAVARSSQMLVNRTTQWMRVEGEEGYRHLWVVGGLTAATNYTAWIVDDQGAISQPIWFSTKESSFPCQLVIPNDICPNVAYAAPLSANTTTTTISGQSEPQPLFSIPDDRIDLISSSLNSFSGSLRSQACGRDLYSHVSSCLDCYSTYRDWLCRIVVPQCGTAVTNDAATVTPQTAARNVSSPRVKGIDQPYDYTELLPCLGVCNAVDRICPAFLGMRCPKRNKNAALGYAYMGNSNQKDDGSSATGEPALDRWGNRWCNG